jgi:primosomal protein N' (replication factor Y)
LTYSVPEHLATFATPGVRVRVPLRARSATGVIVTISETCELNPKTIRAVTEILDPEPLMPPHLFHLAEFITSYYRCPIGDTYAAVFPAGLLRSDGEVVQLATAGAAADVSKLPAKQAAILSKLQEKGKLGVPALLARAGVASRNPLDSLVEAGLAKIRHRRRDHPPEAEVAAVKLPDRPIADLLERCRRAPRRREVLEWLSEQARPAFASEVCAEVGCSPATLRAMATSGLLIRFHQPPPRRSRWSPYH